mmetsp:Transcript_25677/g.60368  ORF Transcript_25677/g.60368 Transcript_25677/m.60368 type:complete len:110 (+) Transcript_25677:2100-2429(+)
MEQNTDVVDQQTASSLRDIHPYSTDRPAVQANVLQRNLLFQTLFFLPGAKFCQRDLATCVGASGLEEAFRTLYNWRGILFGTSDELPVQPFSVPSPVRANWERLLGMRR